MVFLAAFCTTILFVMSAVVTLEVCTGIKSLPPNFALDDFKGSLLVLIPAHNEAGQIETTVNAILKDGLCGMRVLVVADNCTDETAAIARLAGAEVLERFDTQLSGKGYALDYGRRNMAQPFPEVVVIVDGDTVPRPGSLARLASLASHSGKPVQASYILEAAENASAGAKFSAAAFFVKNFTRQLGAMRLGAPAVLTGSGMGFPWAIFANLPLATGHVAEDLMLGVTCALQNQNPIFVPEALIVGVTSSASGTRIQRRRWESGFLATAWEFAIPLVASAVFKLRPSLLWLALHLTAPPLLLLLATNTCLTFLLLILWIFGMSPIWLISLFSMTVLLGAAALVSILASGNRHLLTEWQQVPGYIIWKIKLSISVLTNREKRWIRTDRD